MNDNISLPDWRRLRAGLDEAMKATDCKIDPQIDDDVRIRWYRMVSKLCAVAKDAEKMEARFRYIETPKPDHDSQKE